MLSRIKIFLDNNKVVKYMLILVLFVAVYRAIKKRLDIIKVNNAFSSAHPSGVGTGGEPNVNIQVLAEKLFGLFYSDITEDEAACIATIKSVPSVQISDFSKRYNKLCVDRRGQYHWWTGYNHLPTNLVSDCQYFLEGSYKQVESLLNLI